MLALMTVRKQPTREDVDVLFDSQATDGSWEAVPLLDNHARIWGSRTVSAAFSLKALVRTRELGISQ
jgi:hypothetical protein